MTLVPVIGSYECELDNCENNCLVCEHLFNSNDTICKVAAPGFELD